MAGRGGKRQQQGVGGPTDHNVVADRRTAGVDGTRCVVKEKRQDTYNG